MTEVACNLCGTDDYVVMFEKTAGTFHRLVRCRCCGLMYANPRETVDCLEMTTAQWPKAVDPDDKDRHLFSKSQAQLADYMKALRVVDDFLPGRGRLLEVGCSQGLLLDRIRQDGWQVTGLEPDPRWARYARTTFNLEVIEKTLSLSHMPPASFDAAVMFHVIEHLPDPSADLRELHRVVKTGGLVVIETPRLDSLTFRILKHRERSLINCPGHIYFFTRPTLQRMMSIAGFEVIRVDSVGRTLTLERLLYNVMLIARLPARWQRFLRQKSVEWKLDERHVYINIRDIVRMYGRARQHTLAV